MTLVAGNRITLLETGDEYFPALLEALARARHEVHVETYIFADDRTGRRVAMALAACARRGVLVRVLVDGFGSRHLSPALRSILEAAGVMLRVYRPTPRWPLPFLRHLRRLHRKLVVIDGELAFCGGINLKDDRAGALEQAPRYDFALTLEGPLVGDVHRLVRRLWRALELLHPRAGGYPTMPRQPAPPPILPGHRARLVVRDNLRHRRAIEDAYIQAIERAQQEIFIACAYFLPGYRMRRALVEAVRRGVRVRLLLQGQPDHLMVHTTAYGMYDTLLACGIEIREYAPAHLHAKAAFVDTDWATVGSSNIDPFSLWLSREANVVVEDAALVARLRESLSTAFETRAAPVARGAIRGLPPLLRLQAWCVYRLARLLLGLSREVSRDEF
jgi:cardiolipin synthase